MMKDRLQQFLTMEQISPARLSEILGVQRSGLSHILSGRNKPGFEFIQRFLVKFPSINAEWLITGKGKMYKELSSPNTDISKEPEKITQISENTLFRDEIESEQPNENLVKPRPMADDGEKRTLRKMIMVYSDNTFVELSPSKE